MNVWIILTFQQQCQLHANSQYLTIKAVLLRTEKFYTQLKSFKPLCIDFTPNWKFYTQLKNFTPNCKYFTPNCENLHPTGIYPLLTIIFDVDIVFWFWIQFLMRKGTFSYTLFTTFPNLLYTEWTKNAVKGGT